MKQILQHLGNGNTQLIETPLPAVRQGHILIRSVSSLISAGTEKMLLDFGKAGYLEKAKQQPEKVRMVIDKIKTDGILTTIDAVRSKLDSPIPMGYCNVGVVHAIGDPIASGRFKTGDRVVSNGPHAEFVCVPKNLVAKIPDQVSDEEAAFAVPGAIALQGIRLACPTIGETFVVIGLGLLGQLAAQILGANGCRVLGIDYDKGKCELLNNTAGHDALCLSEGVDPVEWAMSRTGDTGVDGVIITAATKSSSPVHQAALMSRKRGRIVLVGVTGLELNRGDFYEKELSFQVSCSYGPGRYDDTYEAKGNDYPVGYVRWTEQRNFEAVLALMADRKLNVSPMISHRFKFENALSAYGMIHGSSEPYLGVLLNYSEATESSSRDSGIVDLVSAETHEGPVARVCIGLIGAGNFTGQLLLPALKKAGPELEMIVSQTGISGTHLGKKFGFRKSVTLPELVFSDTRINTVVIASRHNTHASYVLEALKKGKHVFVEKPLCLTMEELAEIKAAMIEKQEAVGRQPVLMVGFNRRFAPHIVCIKEMLSRSDSPKSFIITVNAGRIPGNHWTQDPDVGGGRIIGEACHFIDLLRFLAGEGIQSYHMSEMASGLYDTVTIQLEFKNGSMGTVHYFANGNKAFPKERLEIFDNGKIIQLNNFKSMKTYGWANTKLPRLWRQDKGHANCVREFVHCLARENTPPPIPYDELFETTEISIQLAQKG